MKRIVSHSVFASLLLGLCCGCGSANQNDDLSWFEGTERLSVRSSTLSVRWVFPMAPEFSSVYLPVENASCAIDLNGGRVFVGSTNGTLWALSHDAKPIYRYRTDASIEASPVFDARTNQLYVGTVNADIHALRADDGSMRWQAKASGPIRQTPLLLKDALYVVSENDAVAAYARSTGEVLWRYRREEAGGLSIAGHAGIVVADSKLFTAFSDGAVVALDPGDGTVLWEHDTSLDIEDSGHEHLKLLDVDTTPVVVDDILYVASFASGLFALATSSGNEVWRNEEMTSVTAATRKGNYLVLSLANKGVMCIDMRTRSLLWVHKIIRGAPGEPRIDGEKVFVGESDGAFLALSLKTGREIARIEFGHGFSAPASLTKGRGFVLSNSGSLMAFDY